MLLARSFYPVGKLWLIHFYHQMCILSGRTWMGHPYLYSDLQNMHCKYLHAYSFNWRPKPLLASAQTHGDLEKWHVFQTQYGIGNLYHYTANFTFHMSCLKGMKACLEKIWPLTFRTQSQWILPLRQAAQVCDSTVLRVTISCIYSASTPLVNLVFYY